MEMHHEHVHKHLHEVGDSLFVLAVIVVIFLVVKWCKR